MASDEIENTGASDADTGTDHHDRDGQRESLRKDLEDAWRHHGGDLPEKDEDQGRPRSAREREERNRTAEPRGRAAREAKAAASADAKTRDNAGSAPDKAASTDGTAQPAAGGQSADAPPTRWAAQAKQKWSAIDPEVKAAITKGEQDMTKGVEALKARTADIEQAIAPHREMIASHGLSTGTALGRLLEWNQALRSDPKRFFPELLKSFGVSPHDIFPELAAGGSAQQDASYAQQPQQFDQRLVQQIIDARLQPIYTVAQQVQAQQAQQQAARTQATLDTWSRDKKYFSRVRQTMAGLIQSAVAGIDSEGNISLDDAYDAACWRDPAIRAELLAEHDARKVKSYSDRATQARRAGASLSPSSPGSFSNAGKAKRSTGKTVRQSLEEAVSDAREQSRY